MGFFSDLMGIQPEEDDHEGQLYDIRSKLGEKDKPDDKKNKVKSLLSTWHREYEGYGKGNTAPTFALEIHALNDDPSNKKAVSSDPLDSDITIDNPMDGYSAYIFIPERFRKASVSVLANTFSIPFSIPDEYDTLKVLARNYADEYDQEEAMVATRLLNLEEGDHYPIVSWGKEMTTDPLNEIFAIFERLDVGQFAGIQLLIRMADKSWTIEGNMRIREIEDPTYIAHPTMFQKVKNFFADAESKSDMGKKVYRNAGYERQTLDAYERQEVDAIKNKQLQDAFTCTLRVYASSDEIADDICEAIMQRTSGPFNRFKIASIRCRLDDMAKRIQSPTNSFVLSADEISSIWHVPDDLAPETLKKLKRSTPQVTTPPESVVIVPNDSDGDISFLLKNYVRNQLEADDRPQLGA